jgi:hypothetical protein
MADFLAQFFVNLAYILGQISVENVPPKNGKVQQKSETIQGFNCSLKPTSAELFRAQQKWIIKGQQLNPIQCQFSSRE